MPLERKNICPLYREPCKQFDCAWFTQLRGTNPNTGADMDEYACAISFLPILLIEGAKETRQTGAAIESFRNEVARGNESTRNALALNLQNLLGEKPCDSL